MASADRLPLAKLLVLSGAIFVSVSSEFLPTGLLPEIAEGVGVSESRVGLLVSLFAFTVALTTAPLTLLTRRFSRKWLLVVLLGVFALANVLAAFAMTYELLAAARILGGLAHGLFWAVATPYTALLVAPGQLARAISITSGGGTLAFIAGVPFTAAIGHALGWREAFGVMAGLVVVFVVLAVIVLPSVDHRPPPRPVDAGTPAPRDRSVVGFAIVAGTVLLVATGQNLFGTYIAPWAIGAAGIPGDAISLLLLGTGSAGAIGLVLAGAFGDRFPRATLALMASGVAVFLVVAALTASILPLAVAALLLWSVAFGGLPSMFHTRAVQAASPRVRDLSGAVVTTAFNIAIGLGALLGGVVLDTAGVRTIPFVAAAVVAAGLVFVLATDRARLAARADELPIPR